HAFPLSEDLFQSDAIVVKNPPFRSIGFGEKNGPKLLTVHCEDWTAVGLWTKPGAPFFCIEPWWGWADAWDTEGILVQKAGILSLPHGEIREHRYTIEIH
ncbi:MAG: aldose 1-epimerase family protein, partial [Flavobacteriales bacterium]